MSDTVKKVEEEKPEVVRPSKTPQADSLKAKLEAEKTVLEKEMAPYREYLDKAAADPKLIVARQKVKEISVKLGTILNELAALARAKGSQGIKAESGTYAKKKG